MTALRVAAWLFAPLLAWMGPSRDQQATFRSGVDLVRVDVLVTDRGKPVRGLTVADFEVRDNGRVQRIDALFGERAPIDLTLAFDVSASLEGEALDYLKRASLAVLDRLEDGDRVGLVTFSHRVELQRRGPSAPPEVRADIVALRASGSTSLLDAVYCALALAEPGARRPLLLLFSDGRDNRSWLSPEAVIQVARETDTVIYAVAFKAPWRSSEVIGPVIASEPDRKLLGALTGSTGGRLSVESNARNLPALFERILAEMRDRYVLTYYPRDVPRDGWHELSVRLRGKAGSVVARPGYAGARPAGVR